MFGLTDCHRAIVRQGIRWSVTATMVLLATLALDAADVRTFNSVDVPANIPEVSNPVGSQRGTTRSVIQVAGVTTAVSKITVSVYITHSYTSDLNIRLVPPDPVTGAAGTGTGILLMDNIFLRIANPRYPQLGEPEFLFLGNNSQGSAVSAIGTGLQAPPTGRVVFDDAGAIIDRTDPTPHINGGVNNQNNIFLRSGVYAPAQNLAAFNGLSGPAVNGTWTLLIEDDAQLDQGTLRAWSMTITDPGPHTWTGAVDGDWATAGNWQGNNPPDPAEAGAVLIFPAIAAGTVNNATANDYRIRTMSIDGAYNFTTTSTGRLTLIANSTVTVNSPTDVAMDLPIDLIGQPTITVTGAGSFDLNGMIQNDGAAAGLIFAGTGPKSMSGPNIYTGVTAVNASILDVASNGALGTNAGATTVANGATVRVATGLTIPDVISIQGTGVGSIGSLVFSGGTASVGGITLVAGVPASVTVLGGAAAVGAVTAAATPAAHGLSITNAGTIAINGTLPTTTALTLNGGTATFGAAQPNLSSLSLGNGANLNVGASATVSGSITVSGAATTSTISGTTLSLGGGNRSITVSAGAAGAGGEANTTNSDLVISANIATGNFTKQGAGVLRLSGNNAGVGVTVSGGTLAGAGNIGPINVVNGNLSPSGQFTVGGAVNLAAGTGFILPVGASANPAINATGAVTLNGVAGTGGAVLQAYAGAGNTIITAGSVSGTFDGKANGAGITYNPGSVVLAGSGRTMIFNPAGPFTVNEDAGSLVVTVTTTGGAPAPFLRVFGGLIEGRDVSLVGLAPAGTFVFTIPINDNFVDTGDLTGTLAIVPQDGSLIGNSATLTINDNDGSDTKACGFGTGLTVFLLLGFALFFHLRLRRP